MLRIFAQAAAGLFLIAISQGCGLIGQQPRPRSRIDVTGYWQGTSVGYCSPKLSNGCGSVHDIAFTLFQDGSRGRGAYTGVSANPYAPGASRNGAVRYRWLHGDQASLRVSLRGGASCIFIGLFAPDTARGGYFCEQSNGPEKGIWRARRVY